MRLSEYINHLIEIQNSIDYDPPVVVEDWVEYCFNGKEVRKDYIKLLPIEEGYYNDENDDEQKDRYLSIEPSR